MPKRDDELPSIDAADLKSVTGGAGMDMSTILPLALMMKNKNQAPPPQMMAAAPAPPQQVKPKLFVDGVEQPVDGSNGNYSVEDV